MENENRWSAEPLAAADCRKLSPYRKAIGPEDAAFYPRRPKLRTIYVGRGGGGARPPKLPCNPLNSRISGNLRVSPSTSRAATHRGLVLRIFDGSPRKETRLEFQRGNSQPRESYSWRAEDCQLISLAEDVGSTEETWLSIVAWKTYR